MELELVEINYVCVGITSLFPELVLYSYTKVQNY